MASPKYNKAKGAAFEIDVMKWFRSLGILAERLRLAGKDDEGDIVVVIARGIGEVPPAYVIVKRRNAGIEKAWVIQDLEQWIKEKQ